eukprot:1187458-Prorocentrum_minimum.AAC.4
MAQARGRPLATSPTGPTLGLSRHPQALGRRTRQGILPHLRTQWPYHGYWECRWHNALVGHWRL